MKHKMPNENDKKSFSLFYNDLARWFFLFMFFAGMFSAYFLGVQFALNYAVNGKIEFTDLIFTILSILAIIWGIMAHREFTRSSNRVNETRELARQINPQIESMNINPIILKLTSLRMDTSHLDRLIFGIQRHMLLIG